MKRLAKKLEKIAKRAVFIALRTSSASQPEIPVAALQDVARIIVVRPNYRIGNAILSTAVIAPLREQFPGAQIDFLVTNNTAALFTNLSIDNVIAISRSAMLLPWRALAIVGKMRAKRYDLAVQLASSSLSGLMFSRLLGARYIMGQPKDDAAWYHVKVKDPVVHAYDTGTAFSRALGAVGPARTRLAISDEETASALGQLQDLGLALNGTNKAEPFVAVFVGGHADKVCPLSFWLALMAGLDRAGKRFVVFVGPEEKTMLPDLQRALEALPHGTLCLPQPLRKFAAMLAQAQLMITPDSGPMHMAAALSVPVVMMLQTQKSLAFMPPGADSHFIENLDVPQALTAVARMG
ncbi:glycosyltransferase family 9 protein [Pusillimonas sp. MFBS29]|uniref:glycosyltransferase family 9 protein n=1 Tax=Pusillimonas sp. MFBS29 TaxID=2886690 RepID=UPI001D1287CF|nr:glycosyltransferase family 9 protein [Pusillimonas sp. MFBS29]MCC2597640.1 glycosyltransferase family 9 protein [Pusillimonas sp. MFBS29]